MSKEEAVDTLMREWGASESFRKFFTDIVDGYMGETRNVLRDDLTAMRLLIQKQI